MFVSESDVRVAMQEIIKMKDFKHQNVMSLIGVSLGTAMSGGAPSIIMPYMARGSLLSYLRKERDSLMSGALNLVVQWHQVTYWGGHKRARVNQPNKTSCCTTS